ncbi:class I SAM-dependent methyltransferase [Oceanicella sp. SM1341]|uniref:class I SAM-dependent DNA methyltransferase n=1 Tax=Oceanicella sp. SM1341 TaxID=1548889 RepID=UPI000E543251|nr:class I SAM-dependent methyltransferase [Oceanicella sp. SM1341]
MTDRQSDYDHWAWLYDRTVGPAYGRQQMAFLERVMLPRLPAGAQVLDLCCGTGQVMGLLAARGCKVTGLDGSADMLAHARENAPGASLVQGDALSFDLGRRFDAVVCTSASLNHMPGLDALSQVFARVAAHLDEDGVFVFDVNHPAQMRRYWRGQPAEGEIGAEHAWLITPRIDSATGAGSFTVDIWRREGAAPLPLHRRALHRLMGWHRLERARLRRLARFARHAPGWRHAAITYSVHGHELDEVTRALEAAGFDVSLETIDASGPPDERHSAHFVCTRRAEPARRMAV